MVVVLLITVVGSVLVTWLVPEGFHSDPPYGPTVDIVAGTVAAVIWAVVGWQFLSPLIGLSGWPRLLLSVGDAIFLAAAMLWILRRIKG